MVRFTGSLSPQKYLKPLCFMGVLLLGLFVPTSGQNLSNERVVMSTEFGDIEIGFFPEVAPVTVEHILTLFKLGCYNSNHFFRVDKGFVAQTADVMYGRIVPLTELQMQEAEKTVPLEVDESVRHTSGVLSMGRHSDPNSGGSSFSILLGDAPHLDMKYTIFGMVVRGMETLRKMEDVDTKKEGIFVMPLERITIHSSYAYSIEESTDSETYSIGTVQTMEDPVLKNTVEDPEPCAQACQQEADRVKSLEIQLQATREKCLPGNLS